MIGVFDSGIGGLTVVRTLMERWPGLDLIYFGDTARSPYGDRSRASVVRYTVEGAQYLLTQGARAIVVACNTASSFVPAELRRRLAIPIFETITPAAQQAVACSRKGRIGVIGTRATIHSDSYTRAIQALRPDCRVFGQACPLLVPLVEEGRLSKPETVMIVKKYLRPLKVKQIDVLILGCTHYPLLRDLIQAKIGRRVTVIDAAGGVAQAVADYRQGHAVADTWTRGGRYRWVVSDKTPQIEALAWKILKRPHRLELPQT